MQDLLLLFPWNSAMCVSKRLLPSPLQPNVTSTFSDFRPFSLPLPKYLLNPLSEKTILLILGKLTISYFPSLSSEKETTRKSVTVGSWSFSCLHVACAMRHICLWISSEWVCQQYLSVVNRMSLSMLCSIGCTICLCFLIFISTIPWETEMKDECGTGIGATRFKVTIQVLFLSRLFVYIHTLYLYLQSNVQTTQTQPALLGIAISALYNCI